MISGRVLALLGAAMPAFAQYAGPAILTRGEAPSAMKAPNIDFRPYVGLYATYSTGLANVGVTNEGGLANESSYGATLSWGVGGTHNWRHSMVGLDYHGSLTHYVERTAFDSVNQSFLLGIEHQLKRHVTFSMRHNMGIFSRDQGLRVLQQTVPFDPATTYAPTTDFFDNRTVFLSSQADLVIQKSARLSFDLGGDGFITRRRSTALYGVIGGGARGDFQYRVSRHFTLGMQYSYTHFDFTKIFGGTDLHGASLAFGVQLSRTVEFSGYGGAYRVESKFIEQVPIDPVIAQLLGVSSASRVAYGITYTPNASARLSKTFAKGVAFIAGGHTVTPGNGLFLTSFVTSGLAGYTYTGVRRWSFTSSGSYGRSRSIGNIEGGYSTGVGSFSVSRVLGRSAHLVVEYSVRSYGSSSFQKYNRLVQTAVIGLGFAPGEVPLRVW